jgi:hypothetical protein
MLTAIKLNDKPLRMAGEINKVRADGSLSPKMRSIRRNPFDVPPQLAFGESHIAT